MSEESLKKLKAFHKIFFGTTALLVTSCGIYKHFCETRPESVRRVLFDKYYDTYHKKYFESNSLVNVC
jgi:hypothetical protein